MDLVTEGSIMQLRKTFSLRMFLIGLSLSGFVVVVMMQPLIQYRAEQSALKTLKYVDAWCVFFWATTPTIVCLVTFSALVVLRGAGAPPLRVSSIFAGGC